MNARSRDKNWYLMLALSAGLTIVVLFLAGFLSIAGAQPDPLKPPYEWRLVEAPDVQPMTAASTVDLNSPDATWWPVFTDNFENNDLNEKWLLNIEVGNNPALGFKWGTRQWDNSLDPSSMYSAWAIGGGEEGIKKNLLSPSYPSSVNSWLVAGPFDFSNATDILVQFDLYYEATNLGEPGIADSFSVAVSENLDQKDFVIQAQEDQNVDAGSWAPVEVPLSAYAGKPKLYIAFIFESDYDANKRGALIDNVRILSEGDPGTYMPYVAYGFTPTPPPVPPTATPPPGGGDYKHDFTDSIDPWQARRWTSGTNYVLSHVKGADDGYDGFLNLLVNTSGSKYVIASPLVAGKAPPYNIETVVKLRSERKDGDQYGVVFGGNYNGGDCPVVTDFSTCFTQYYEMRVYYWHDDAANKDRMKMKLKRIDSHDSENNNNGPDLIEWTGNISDIDETGFIEWDITVKEDGKISISADGQPLGSATDSTYINNPYFGVIVRTEDHSDAEAKYDYFKID